MTWQAHGGLSKKTPSFLFGPKMLKFYPYSILTGETIAGFVTYCVLDASLCNKTEIHY